MKSRYKILKLKSGEEIITKIVGSTSNKITLERPMVFKTGFQLSNDGRKKEITFLRDWLQNTNEIKIEIPKDHIASFLVPSSKVSKLYDFEKESQDIDGVDEYIDQTPKIPKNDSMKNILDEFYNGPSKKPTIDDILKDLIQNKEEDVDKSLQGFLDSMEDSKEFDQIMDQNSDEQEFIILNMMFPPQMLRDMIDRGIIDPKELGQILDSTNDGPSDKYTGDQTDRKDFGNRWTDWPFDTDEYFD